MKSVKEGTTRRNPIGWAQIFKKDFDPSPATENQKEAAKSAKEEDEKDENLLQQIKNAGLAGVIAYAITEVGFWAVSLVLVLGGYVALEKHLPDWSNQQEMGKLGAEAFAYVNVARFAAPLRIGLALGLTPWIQKSFLDPFQKKDETHDESESS